MFTIYLLTSPSGKHYVGQTRQTLSERWKNGTGYKSCVALNKAIEKYGWEQFEHEILAVCEDADLADELEKKYIQEYNCIVPNGYNIDFGGNANKFMSEETKRKIGEANKGKVFSEETRTKMSESMKGRIPWNKGKCNVYTDEARKAMSEGMKGRPSPRKGVHLSEETRQKLSEAKKGKPSPKKGKKYKPLSEETKAKLSAIHKGKPSPMKGRPWSEARRAAQERKREGKQCELLKSEENLTFQ